MTILSTQLVPTLFLRMERCLILWKLPWSSGVICEISRVCINLDV